MTGAATTGADRLARLQGALASAELDALLVTSLPNIRYLSGFSGSNALLLVPAAGEATLWTDFRYATQVKTEVGEGVRALVPDRRFGGEPCDQSASPRAAGALV